MADEKDDEHAHAVGHGVAVHCDSRGSRIAPFRPAKDGQPIGKNERLFRRGPDGTYRPVESKGGPSMVNSADFKTGWERLFGAEPVVGEA